MLLHNRWRFASALTYRRLTVPVSRPYRSLPSFFWLLRYRTQFFALGRVP
jgi:hypothetical protein